MNYDIIGDIHGHSLTLETLLTYKLDYKKKNGVYQHPDRKIIFLGDFIDRGKFQCEVLDIVRPMIESGSALSIMGNHEYNAIAYYTRDNESDGYLRDHSEKNSKQHKVFLDAYENFPDKYEDVINWFKSLPLWLDLGELRVVHACWDKDEIAKIIKFQSGSNYLSNDLLKKSCDKDTWQFSAIETILKGKEIPLKNGASFKDKDGNERHNIRIRWWDSNATSYKKAFMGPESARTHIPDDKIKGDHLVEYSHKEPPVFLGHYWLEKNVPVPLDTNIACLDYSVAKPGGKLVAYRWDGERILNQSKFIWVDRLEP